MPSARRDSVRRPGARPLLSVVLAGALVAACDAPALTGASGFTDAEHAAMAALAAQQPGWRMAEERDNTFPEGIREARDRIPGYHPYRLRGDWNRDGMPDLALVLVRDSTFAAWWLPGTRTGYGAAQELGQVPELRWGGLFEHEGGLLVGPFQSDAVWVYRWDPRAGTLALEPNE